MNTKTIKLNRHPERFKNSKTTSQQFSIYKPGVSIQFTLAKDPPIECLFTYWEILLVLARSKSPTIHVGMKHYCYFFRDGHR
jgi:hypothetical protein